MSDQLDDIDLEQNDSPFPIYDPDQPIVVEPDLSSIPADFSEEFISDKPTDSILKKKIPADNESPLISDQPTGGAKSTPPKADEWQRFFSRIVLRTVINWYVDFVFRDIDEDLISDKDLEKLTLSEEDRNTIAKPLAEFANKNKWARKHGREIISFAGSFESLLILARYMNRVRRISSKYRVNKPQKPKNVRITPEKAAENNGSNGQNQAQEYDHASTTPFFPDGTVISNPGSG